ncbi:MAG TPA: glycerophosphodiester phosphodiesterase family protein [Balneolaceae bacterium]|nr:glycerophosphodiester phosphodiesterase family protein [Balneolaceae bacterium]
MSKRYKLPSLFHPKSDECLVIAHRGASAYFPENTMVAFEAALKMEADMIEVDVTLSKDGIPVIFHDPQLNAHSSGKGFVSNYTLNELKKLDAGLWFHREFLGEKIPTLEEVLAFASGKIALNIEIKPEAVTDETQGGIEEKCIELIREYGMDNYVLFSSFDYRSLKHLRKLDSKIPVALLYAKFQAGRKSPYELVSTYQADAFNCSYTQFTQRRRANLKEHQIPFFIYTINSKKRMKKLIDAGVSGIFTDKPDVLKGVIESH